MILSKHDTKRISLWYPKLYKAGVIRVKETLENFLKFSVPGFSTRTKIGLNRI